MQQETRRVVAELRGRTGAGVSTVTVYFGAQTEPNLELG